MVYTGDLFMKGLEKEVLLWYSGGKGSEVRLREALLWSYMAGWGMYTCICICVLCFVCVTTYTNKY